MASKKQEERSDGPVVDDSSSSADIKSSGPEGEDIDDEIIDPDDDSPFEDEDFAADETPRAPKASSKAGKGNDVKSGRATGLHANGGSKKKKARIKSGPVITIAPSTYVPVWINAKRPREIDTGVLNQAAAAALAIAKRGAASSGTSLSALSSAYQQARQQQQKKKAPRIVVLSDDDAEKEEEHLPCEFCGSAFAPAVLLNHQRRCQEERVRRERLDFLAAKKQSKAAGSNGAARAESVEADRAEVIDLSEEEQHQKAFWREHDARILQQRARPTPRPNLKRLREAGRQMPDEDSGPVLLSDDENGHDSAPLTSLRRGRTRGEERKTNSAEEEREEQEAAERDAEDDEEGGSHVDDSSDGGAVLLSKCETFAATKRAILSSAPAVVTVQPSSLKKELSDYQVKGLNWLCLLHAQGVNGILADEMGLGKTIQTIAFFAQLQLDGCQLPHLVIVPATTLDNWRRELAAWCPSLDVRVYWGSLKERESQKITLLRGQHYNVLLTTYNLAFQRADRAFLKRLKFEYLVLDEAHNVKNSASQRHQRLSRLPSNRRLLLTGTPLQNNLGELWALLSFLMPRIFANTEAVPALLRTGEAQQVERMKAMLAPFILRRLKSQVQQSLRHKTEHIERVRLDGAAQAQLYRRLIARSRAEWAAGAALREDAGKENTEKRQRGQNGEVAEGGEKESTKNTTLINIIMQLQKACNHPCLSRTFYTDKDITTIARTMRRDEWEKMTQEEAEASLKIYSDLELHNVCIDYPSLASLRLPDEKLLYSSAKMSHLRTRLPELHAQGHRILLFSQMTRVLDILEVLLERIGLAFLRLDGQTPVPERQKLIDKFNADNTFAVFLLSTKAGGLGINLTSADTVVFFDSSFNPQQDRQAEDRCHRIGQKKEVTVLRLICEGTLEEHILKRAAEKLRLNDAILEEGSAEERQHVTKILASVFAEQPVQ